MHVDSSTYRQRSSALSDTVTKLLPVAIPPSAKLERLHRNCLLASPSNSSTPIPPRGMKIEYAPYPCLSALRIPEEVTICTYESTDSSGTESGMGEVNTKTELETDMGMEMMTVVKSEKMCATLTDSSENTPLRSSSLLENISFSPFMNFTPESDFKTPGAGTGQFIALNRITPFG